MVGDRFMIVSFKFKYLQLLRSETRSETRAHCTDNPISTHFSLEVACELNKLKFIGIAKYAFTLIMSTFNRAIVVYLLSKTGLIFVRLGSNPSFSSPPWKKLHKNSIIVWWKSSIWGPIYDTIISKLWQISAEEAGRKKTIQSLSPSIVSKSRKLNSLGRISEIPCQ